MTLQEAITFFDRLNNETSKQSEIKIYEKFSLTLSQLKNRPFSEEELHSIEMELDRLNLEANPKNRKKYFRKALSQFEKHLKETFSLTPKEYYTNLGIRLGSSYGILFGLVFLSHFDRSLGISLGMIFGMFIGLTIGKSLDAKATSKGDVI